MRVETSTSVVPFRSARVATDSFSAVAIRSSDLLYSTPEPIAADSELVISSSDADDPDAYSRMLSLNLARSSSVASNSVVICLNAASKSAADLTANVVKAAPTASTPASTFSAAAVKSATGWVAPFSDPPKLSRFFTAAAVAAPVLSTPWKISSIVFCASAMRHLVAERAARSL